MDDAETDSKCSVHRMPHVSICFRVCQDALQLGVRIQAPTEGPASCEARLMCVSLDNVVVARNRGMGPLFYTKRMAELSGGAHRVQYLIQFDSGDLVMYNRVLGYHGSTTARNSAATHALRSHGSGMLAPRQTVLWRVDEQHALPCVVTLRAVCRSPLYLQACQTTPSLYQPPCELESGEARLVLSDDRSFVVGSHGSGETPYDLVVRPAAARDDDGAWPAQPPTGRGRYALCLGLQGPPPSGSMSWTDADAVSWLETLGGLDFQCRLLGDGQSCYAPHAPFGVATRQGVRASLRSLAVRDGDTVALVSTGGGHAAALACIGEQGAQDGSLLHADLAEDVAGLVARGARVFVFVDACNGADLAAELERRAPAGPWFLATAWPADGEEWAISSGSFTHAFLVKTLVAADMQSAALGDVFARARDAYRFKDSDGVVPFCAGDARLALF